MATAHSNPIVRTATMLLTRLGIKYVLNFLRKNVEKGLPDKDRVAEPVPVKVLNS